MVKKSLLWSLLLFVATLIGFSSCSDDNNNDPDVLKEFPGAYILNSGKMGTNSAVLTDYYLNTSKISNLFEKVNGVGLGDTAQDMIIYGGKTYIAMYGSGLIYVVDKNNKILATIKNIAATPLEKLQPRAFESYKGKVYVTLFDGYLARIDTTTLTIDKKIAVGLNPEAVKAVNNKLYVANSGGMNYNNGYDNRISIVDPELAVKKDITVAVNPCELKLDKYNNLYLVSRGDYVNVPNTLQKIDTNDDTVTKLAEGLTYSIFPEGDRLYMLKKEYDANYNPSSSFTYYDIINKKVVEQSFITDGTVIKDVSFIRTEPKSGDIYVLAANGTNNGDGYIFSSTGKLKSKFDTGGAFPIGVWFIN